MKKLLFILITIILCGSFCFAAAQPIKPNHNHKPPQIGFHGSSRMGYAFIFGIKQEDFNNLKLSNEQKEKTEKIVKKYIPNNQKFNFNEIEKNKNKAKSEFRGLLTSSQKKTFDKAVETQKKQNKEIISKIYKNTAKELNFTDQQNKKLNELINKFDGNFMEFNKKFESIMTADQKKKHKENQIKFKNRSKIGMKHGMKHGGFGMPPKGKGPKPNDFKPQHK